MKTSNRMKKQEDGWTSASTSNSARLQGKNQDRSNARRSSRRAQFVEARRRIAGKVARVCFALVLVTSLVPSVGYAAPAGDAGRSSAGGSAMQPWTALEGAASGIANVVGGALDGAGAALDNSQGISTAPASQTLTDESPAAGSLGIGSSKALKARNASTQYAKDDALVVKVEGLDEITDRDGDTILYNLQSESEQKVYIYFAPDMFSGNNKINVTATLPDYGFVYEGRQLDDPTDKAITDPRIVKDAYGNDKTYEFSVNGSDGGSHELELKTIYGLLPNAQCAAAIENGWQDSVLRITVKDDAGTILAENTNYKVRPKVGEHTNAISVAEHEHTVVGDRRGANAGGYYSGSGGDGGQGDYALVPSKNDKGDIVRVTLETAGNQNNTGLVRINGFRLYAPTNKVRLLGTSNVTGEKSLSGAFSFDPVAKTDENNREYYYFTARNGGLFNNGAAAESVTYSAKLRWQLKEGEDNRYLDANGGSEFTAPDMQFDYSYPGSPNASVSPNKSGSVIKTFPADYNKRKRNYFIDGLNHRTSGGVQVAPGGSLSNQIFMYAQDSNLSGAYGGVEHRLTVGGWSETWTFPFEVRPTKIKNVASTWPQKDYLEPNNAYKSVTCTVVNINDESQSRTVNVEPGNLYDYTATGANGIDLSDVAGEGERISQVVVELDPAWTPYYYTFFDLDVTEKHANNTSLTPGELLNIHYAFSSSMYNSAERDLYLLVVDPVCPWLMSTKASGSPSFADLWAMNEFPLADFWFKGPAGGTSRDYYDHPKISLGMNLSRSTGLSEGEALLFLSGDMTLTPNMSGWKITYSVFDTETHQSREGLVYQVGDLSEDTPLRRVEDLGLTDTECFTSFVLSYDGVFQFTGSKEINRTTWTYDGAQAGTYLRTDLLKGVKARMRCQALDGTLIGSDSTATGLFNVLRLFGTLSHDGSCNRAAHGTESGQQSMCEVRGGGGGDSVVSAHTDHVYTLRDPSFKAQSSQSAVHQGGTIVGTLSFNVINKMKYEAHANGAHYHLPGGVSETLYVELLDPDVQPDLTNADFLRSLAAHGISADSVEVVNTGSGATARRWLKMTTGSDTATWRKRLGNPVNHSSALGYHQSFTEAFTLALRVGKSHETGDDICTPIGEVYWDISGYLDKYQGSIEASRTTVLFNGAVAAPADLAAVIDADSGSAPDTTTERLWKGDASNQKLTVLLNYGTGASVDPGKRGIVYNSSMSYATSDRNSMFAAVTMNSPNTNDIVYDYDAVLKLPAANEAYTWTVDGSEVSRTSDTALTLTGAAYVYKSTLEGSTTTCSYSIDGSTWVSESTAQSNWSAYRYVKIHADKIDPYKSFEVRFPVTTDDPVSDAGKVSYLGGTWAFASSEGGPQGNRTKMAPALYQMAPQPEFAITKNLKAPANLAPNGAHDHSYAFGAGDFSFTITPTANAPMPGGATSDTQSVTAATIADDGAQTGGVATFTGPEYDTAGTYTYTVHEVIPDDAVNADGVKYSEATDTQKAAGGFTLNGVNYTSRSESFRVVVAEDPETGRLVATPSTITPFVNRYEMDDATLTLGGKKTLIGADGQPVASISGYSFVLEQKQADGTWAEKYDTAVRANGAFNFTPLKFTQLDYDLGTEHVYRIREVIPADAVNADGIAYSAATDEQKAAGGFAKAGVTYDQTAYTATVTLVDNGNGTMTPQVAYAKVRDANGADITPTTVADASGIAFQNTYECKAEVALQATKDLAGRNWTSDDAFTFKLEADHAEDSNGNTINATVPMPSTYTVEATSAHKTTSFEAIPFGYEHIGNTYVYKITEPTPTSPEENMRYSSAVYLARVKVVKDNGDGTMETEVSYVLSSGDQTIPAAYPEFLNKSVGHGTANLFVKKNLTGREWADDDVFTFMITADHVENPIGTTVTVDHDIPMPTVNTATATKDDETAEFGAIHFNLETEGNVYYYKIREQAPDGATLVGGKYVKDGITYSDEVLEARVRVHHLATDANKMTADVEYKVKNEDGEWVWINEPLDEIDNAYEAAPVTVSNIQVQKQLKAPANLNATGDYDQAYAFEANKYSFTLKPGANEAGVLAPMPDDGSGGQLASMTASAAAGEVDASGKVVANTGMAVFNAIEFDTAGSYVYTVTENIPDTAKATIDGTQWTYAEATAAGSGVSAEAIATAAWQLAGVTYTETTHNVFVTVTDDGKGQLESKVEYRDPENVGGRTTTPSTFTNRYHTTDVNVTISGTKAMDGNSSVAGYTFKLERMEDEDSSRPGIAGSERFAGSDASGTFTFGDIVFPQWRLGKTTVYHATEVVPDDAVNAAGVAYKDATADQKAAGGFTKDGVTYDASMFEVSVEISDNGDGTASASTTYKRLRNADGTPPPADDVEASGLSFTNTYRITGSVSTQFQAAKRICDFEGNAVEGWKIDSGRNQHDWSGDSFGITLTAGENTAGAGVETPMPQGSAGGVKMVDATLDTAKSNTLAFVEFGNIEFTAPGTYHYTIEENLANGATADHPVDSSGHLAYDVSTRGVTVVVEDNGKGGLTEPVVTYKGAVGSAATGAEGIPLFTNREAGDDDIVLRTVKKVEGGNLVAGMYEFELYEADSSYNATGDPLAVATNGADGTAAGVPREYTVADLDHVGDMPHKKTFYYVGREVIPDGAVNADGSLTYRKGVTSYADRMANTWTKDGVTYSTAESRFAVTVTEHVLTPTDERVEENSAYIEKLEVGMSDVNNGAMTTVFDLPYDPERTTAQAQAAMEEVYRSIEWPVRTNAYEAVNEASVNVEKVLEGREMTDGDSFTFQLIGMDGAPLRTEPGGASQNALSATVTKDAPSTAFESLVFDMGDLAGSDGVYASSKTFGYIVREIAPDEAVNAAGVAYKDATDAQKAAGGFTHKGITYAADQYLYMTVKDNGDGTLDVSYEIAGSDTPVADEPTLVFTNTYEATGPAEADPPVVAKVVEGDAPETDAAFTFVMEAVTPDAPMPEGAANGKLTAAVKNGEKHEFGTMSYNQAGEYVYRIYEQEDAELVAAGYTFDKSEWVVTVRVGDNGEGKLVAERSFTKDGAEVTEANAQITVTNKFTKLNDPDPDPDPDPSDPEPCTIGDPPVRKVVSGDKPSKPGSFTFTMTRDDASFPEVEGSVDGVRTVVQKGEGAVEFGNIAFTTAGVYTYTVAEVPGNDPHYTYDDTKFTVRYDVTEVDGALECTRTFLDEQGNVIEGMEMATVTNDYDADPDPTGKPAVSVVKSADKDTVKSGDTVTYTLEVNNNGDAAATGVYVKDYVPAGMTYVSCDGAGAKYGSTTDGNAFATWWIESLAPNTTETLTLVVRVNECRDGDKFENTALWEETGGTDRPSPSKDPEGPDGDGTSNSVVITGKGDGTSGGGNGGGTSGGGSTRPSTRSAIAKTGDELLPVALTVGLAAMASIGLAAFAARRRRNE